MITRPGNEEVEKGGFHSLASLWQSDDPELAAGLGKLAEERRRFQEETQALKAEAEAMITEAKAKAKQIEEEARAKGLAEGKAQTEAEEKGRFAKIDALLTELEGERQRFHQQYEDDMLTLIKAMVDRVLFHELKANPQAIELCLKKALTYVVEDAQVVIRLHGKDLERLQQAAQERPELLAGYQKIELVEDPTLAMGGCILDSGFGEINASLESRKDKVFAAIDAAWQEATLEPPPLPS